MAVPTRLAGETAPLYSCTVTPLMPSSPASWMPLKLVSLQTKSPMDPLQGGTLKVIPARENPAFAPMVAFTASVIENGWPVGPGPVTVVAPPVPECVNVPTVVPVPNWLFVLST